MSSTDKPRFPYTTYGLVGPVMRLPGSSGYNSLPSVARETYGRLVAAGLGSWGEDVPWTRVERPRGGNAADPIRFSSPAQTFLRELDWVPVTRPGMPGEEDFARAADAWHYQESDAEAQPTFMPLVVSQVRALIDSSAPTSTLLRELGLHIWNERTEALERLRVLATIYEELEIAVTLISNFRKAYERTWALVVRGPGVEPVGVGNPDSITRRRRNTRG